MGFWASLNLRQMIQGESQMNKIEMLRHGDIADLAILRF
jgi:hypothetical protein